MERCLITHSLLSSWLYLMKDNPFSDATNEPDDPLAEFMQVLRREPTETSEAMQKGIDFEDLVTAITIGGGDEEAPWYEAASEVAEIVGGGVLQYKAMKEAEVDGVPLLLYGRLDALKAGEIIDIKYSGSYERGKFYDSTQHPMYFELIPEAERFTYAISNGTNVWRETYDREETKSIYPIISQFIQWLKLNNLFEIYVEKWASKK